MYKVIDLKPEDGFRLRLRFSDGVEGVANLSDLAGRGVMNAWNDREVFEAMTITDAGAVEWAGGIDLCDDSLYLRVTGKQPEELFSSLSVRFNA